MTHIPVKKTIHTIWCLEHSLGLNMPGVYCIPYDCDMVYVGQPNRSIQIRFKEPIRHLCLGQPGKSAVAWSIMETGHCRRFNETHTLSRTTGYMHHLLKKRPFRHNYTQTNSTETEISCSTRPGNLHSGSYWLQLPTNDVAAIFALHSDTYWLTSTHKPGHPRLYKQGSWSAITSHFPDDRDGASLWNVGMFKSPDVAEPL